ncbi:phospholipase A2, minor isoenzyme-like [Coregonus clupeaformis]|uniref:phospholipase A2, minor isoenzyme-like n=1 Tax=Coregonus clupeaformis TaxID=59861 RepID=UPI001BE0ADF8|nr:phospholipase A2, minor isoenzyme-like [Coregonus clupeaformis]
MWTKSGQSTDVRTSLPSSNIRGQVGVSPRCFPCHASHRPPVAADRCCEVHDHCYEASRHLPECRPVIDSPYINRYRFSCTNGQVSCSASNHVCQASVCECDRVATNCFAQSTYNPENKNLDPKVHCLS